MGGGKDKVDDRPAASSVPPSLITRFWHSLESKGFWEQAGRVEFWEQGCLGRSISAGGIVGLLAGLHRFRNVRSFPLALERTALGFLFGSSINYFGCRQVFEEAIRQSKKGKAASS